MCFRAVVSATLTLHLSRITNIAAYRGAEDENKKRQGNLRGLIEAHKKLQALKEWNAPLAQYSDKKKGEEKFVFRICFLLLRKSTENRTHNKLLCESTHAAFSPRVHISRNMFFFPSLCWAGLFSSFIFSGCVNDEREVRIDGRGKRWIANLNNYVHFCGDALPMFSCRASTSHSFCLLRSGVGDGNEFMPNSWCVVLSTRTQGWA